MEILQTMSRLILQPWLASLPALGLFILFGLTRDAVARVAAWMWTVYALYELGMKYRILCSGECNIRIDLLVVYPLLLVVSVLALASVLLVLWQRYRHS